MNSVHEIAIAFYERALAHFARRADASYPTPAVALEATLAERAEQLALNASTQEEDSTPRPLKSIVGRLFHEQTGQTYDGYYAPQPMQNAAALPKTEVPTSLRADYQALWQQFQDERTRLEVDRQPLPVREAALHALLQRYCWAMPAPGADDVSLYDFARTSAALAVCLQDEAATDDEVALLVGADLSGVQDWLYSFSSRGAAKSLRGRSFYLQLLMEVIAFFVLDQLDLPRANLLYVGGGNFYLLAPVGAAARLDDLRRIISNKLRRMHRGDLYVAIAAAPVSAATLRGDVGEAWAAVNRLLNRVKARRFAELTPEEMATVIGQGIGTSGMEEDVCAVCRRGITAEEHRRHLVEPITGAEERNRCGQCTSFEKLGNLLPRARFLTMAQVEAGDDDGVIQWQEGLRQFGYQVDLLRDAQDPDVQAWSDPGSMVFLYYWSNAFEKNQFPGAFDPARTVVGFRPLAQCVPYLDAQETEIATFDKLKSDGIPRWGVLRMDVDHLGRIFQEGIPANSLSRVVGLSGLMRLFFEGRVPAIGEEINDETGQPRLYLMYAGGDDLFVVGGWSDLPTLAARIRQQFGAFACGNPRVTISGGISIALDTNYPLYQAARQAGAAEDRAKRQGRNALAFLGDVIQWSDYVGVEDRVSQLAAWIDPDTGKLNRSFLGALRTVDAEWRAWRKREQGESDMRGIESRYDHSHEKKPLLYLGPWQWHLVYSLKRAAQRTKDDKLIQAVDAWTKTIVGGEIRTLGLIARWAELLTRRTENGRES